MDNETKEEQYLRILTSGINGESDYEAAKYLNDKGYIECEFRTSRGRDDYSKIVNAVCFRTTADGFDFMDLLREKQIEYMNQKVTHKATNNGNNDKIKWWKDTFAGSVFFALLIFAITTIAKYFGFHFGMPFK